MIDGPGRGEGKTVAGSGPATREMTLLLAATLGRLPDVLGSFLQLLTTALVLVAKLSPHQGNHQGAERDHFLR